jgi:tight adherence protein C
MSMSQPHLLFAVLAVAAPLGLTTWRLSCRHRQLVRLQSVLGGLDGIAHHPLLAALERLGRRIPGAEDTALRELLLQAGFLQPAALPIFTAARFIAAAGTAALMVAYSHGSQLGRLLVGVFAVFFVYRLFVIGFKLKAEARQRAIRREMPPVIDVLLMVLNSGVSIDQCLHYVSGMLEHTAPLTGQMLRRYAADVDSGVPYETAFERMGQRLGIDEGYDLAALIKQSLLQGGDILAPLERFGAEIADRRVAGAREQIGRKSVLLTLVMLAFFMPVLLITLGGPAVSNITETLKIAERQIHHQGGRP